MGAVQRVKDSADWISINSSFVIIKDAGIERLAASLAAELRSGVSPPKWDFDQVHFNDHTDLTAQYLLVVDSLNFCFWPDPDFHYSHLASGLRASLQHDPTCLDAEHLCSISGPQLRNLIGWHRKLPLEDERARLLQEVGHVLKDKFDGKAGNVIRASQGSAAALVDLITSNFTGFQDHCVYKGRQMAFYKRAQIFAADIWGAYGGHSLGSFSDIDSLTMFADYLVPCILHDTGVLEYSEPLKQKVINGIALLSGCEEEVELRGCSIAAVEKLRSALDALRPEGQPTICSVELDWWLWSRGIASKTMIPHHKTTTVYY